MSNEYGWDSTLFLCFLKFSIIIDLLRFLYKNMRNKENLIWLLIILVVRVAFLLWDAYFSGRESTMDTVQIVPDTTAQDMTVQEYNHNSANLAEYLAADTFGQVEQDVKDAWIVDEQIDIQDTPNLVADSIATLQKMYQNNKNPDVLKILITKLLQNYQFKDAKQYLADVDIFVDDTISIKDYTYTYINTLSITDTTSISKFSTFITQANSRYLLSADDYAFYKWLIYLRNKNYNQAMLTFDSISNKLYAPFITQISWSISTYKNQQWVPDYYEDTLIALTCLKNWYFSIANKLATDVVLQDGNYILPYQILAYSNFMTKDREKAVDYFYKLLNLDPENYETYNFFIWVSYYRIWNYEKSIVALVPLIDSKYKNDVYRYLLLDYKQMDDQNKIIQIRQKQLWTTALRESDFKYFFDEVFFTPFANGDRFTLYREYGQLAVDFVTMCFDKFGESNPTCIYGEVWLNIANSNRDSAQEELIYLADTYPQASIYQALWNYYKINGNLSKAKTYYLKAITMSENDNQKDNIQHILLNLLD